MTRYAYDTFVREGDIVIDEDEKTIYVTRNMTAIAFHRTIQDLFDQPEYLVFANPTNRIADDRIQMQPPWLMGNPECISSGLLEHLDVVEYEDNQFRLEVREKEPSFMSDLLFFVGEQFKRFRS